MDAHITDIPGILVGHYHDEEALTGCTVVLCQDGAVGGADQRGGAPGTRETDALNPMHLVQHVHAVVLSGGSAFGLDAATGVVQWLEERNIGFDAGIVRVPIVPSAILFDLGIGSSKVRPDATFGYRACKNASSSPPEEGCVGAGSGATVGKILGMASAVKSGIGTAAHRFENGLIVGALAAVNSFGEVVDPSTGEIVAGPRNPDPDAAAPFLSTMDVLERLVASGPMTFGRRQNTVIGVVATNALLSKEQVNKVAQMAHDGIARAVRPSHTMLDGDTIFALSLGDISADVNIVGAFAARVFAEAILRAVRAATPAGGLPSTGSL